MVLLQKEYVTAAGEEITRPVHFPPLLWAGSGVLAIRDLKKLKMVDCTKPLAKVWTVEPPTNGSWGWKDDTVSPMAIVERSDFHRGQDDDKPLVISKTETSRIKGREKLRSRWQVVQVVRGRGLPSPKEHEVDIAICDIASHRGLLLARGHQIDPFSLNDRGTLNSPTAHVVYTLDTTRDDAEPELLLKTSNHSLLHMTQWAIGSTALVLNYRTDRDRIKVVTNFWRPNTERSYIDIETPVSKISMHGERLFLLKKISSLTAHKFGEPTNGGPDPSCLALARTRYLIEDHPPWDDDTDTDQESESTEPDNDPEEIEEDNAADQEQPHHEIEFEQEEPWD